MSNCSSILQAFARWLVVLHCKSDQAVIWLWSNVLHHLHVTKLLVYIWHNLRPISHMTCDLYLTWPMTYISHNLWPISHMTCDLYLTWPMTYISHNLLPISHMTCDLYLTWPMTYISHNLWPISQITCDLSWPVFQEHLFQTARSLHRCFQLLIIAVLDKLCLVVVLSCIDFMYFTMGNTPKLGVTNTSYDTSWTSDTSWSSDPYVMAQRPLGLRRHRNVTFDLSVLWTPPAWNTPHVNSILNALLTHPDLRIFPVRPVKWGPHDLITMETVPNPINVCLQRFSGGAIFSETNRLPWTLTSRTPRQQIAATFTYNETASSE